MSPQEKQRFKELLSILQTVQSSLETPDTASTTSSRSTSSAGKSGVDVSKLKSPVKYAVHIPELSAATGGVTIKGTVDSEGFSIVAVNDVPKNILRKKVQDALITLVNQKLLEGNFTILE